jgi:hypothetical protein
MKKWSNPIGDSHKNKIFKIIQKHGLDGIYQHEIIKESALSRQTVYTILKKLRAENKIHKFDDKYSVIDDTADIAAFETVISGFFILMMSKKEHISEMFEPTFSRYHKADNLTEKHVFEFANAIGAFITYMLIESKRPNEYDGSYDNIVEMTDILIEDILSINMLFERFGLFFGNIPPIRTYTKMSSEDFDKVSKAFMKVYPKFYESLEDIWKMECNYLLRSSPLNEKFKNCNHEWEKHYMYKFGNYDECIHCHYRQVNK